jgi:DNA-binding protein H-NS
VLAEDGSIKDEFFLRARQTKGDRGRSVLVPQKLQDELLDCLSTRFKLKSSDLHVLHYTDTNKQKEAIEAQIAAAQQAQRSDAVNKVRAIISEHHLTQKDIFGSSKAVRKSSVNKVAAKYKDPISGSTWTGRGKAPKWIDGQDRAKFVIA